MSSNKERIDNASVRSGSSLDTWCSRRKKGKVARTYKVDGIEHFDDPETYIHRKDLVSKAIASTREKRFLVIGSPPGTGKTALSQLIIKQLMEENDRFPGEKIVGFTLRPKRPHEITSLFDYVEKKTGISFEEGTLSGKSEGASEVWLIFDDAQKLYGDNCLDFWEDVVKNQHVIQKDFGTAKIIVVVLATYYLSSTNSSPVCFVNENRLGVTELRLTKEEASDLYRRRCMCPDWNEYFERLYYVTNGHAAAFTIGMNFIVDYYETVERRSKGVPSENDVLSTFIEEPPFVKLRRCFPIEFMNEDHRSVVSDTLFKAYQAKMGERPPSTQRYDIVNRLAKVGILDLEESGRFASPIAQRFYFREVFPRTGTEAPLSLDDLIVQATAGISARRLRAARDRDGDGVVKTPKEAVYHQLYHEAIASLLPLSYEIIPELGTKATNGGKVVTGELDFYIKNGSKWALELLRDGKDRKEHLDRIPGKYSEVVADSWLVLDCRADGVTPRLRDNNLCTLVFSDDFRSCQCYMRQDSVVRTIKLAE